MPPEGTIELLVKTGTFLVTAWGVFRGFIKYLEKKDSIQASAVAETISIVVEKALIHESRQIENESQIKELSEKIEFLGRNQAEIRSEYQQLNKTMADGFTHVNKRIDEVLNILANHKPVQSYPARKTS